MNLSSRGTNSLQGCWLPMALLYSGVFLFYQAIKYRTQPLPWRTAAPSKLPTPFGPRQEPPCLTTCLPMPLDRTNKHEELNATQQLQLTDPKSWNLPIKSWHWGGRGKPGLGRRVLTSCIVGPTGHSARASLSQSDKRWPSQASQSIRAAGGIWGNAPQLLSTTESAFLRKKEYVTTPQACQELLGPIIPAITPHSWDSGLELKCSVYCRPRFFAWQTPEIADPDQQWQVATLNQQTSHQLPPFNATAFSLLTLSHSNVFLVSQGK